MFFQALHHAHAGSNVVHVKQRDEFIVDPATLIAMCVHYFKELIDPQLLMINEASKGCHKVYDVLGCIVITSLVMNWMRISQRMKWTRFKAPSLW